MGMHGNIVIWPKGGSPRSDPAALAQKIVQVFESAGLLRPGTTSALSVTHQECSATFEEHVEHEAPQPEDYAYILVEPEYLEEALGELVYVLAEDVDGNPSPIELPYLEISVFSKPVPIPDPASGDVLAQSWAAVEFSYEDARLSEEVHRIRDEEHPVLDRLRELFGTSLDWGVVAY